MRIFSLALCVFFLFSFSENDKIRIAWQQDRKLSWSDFKGKPESGNFIASTNSGISFSFSITKENDAERLDYTVRSYFYPESSWYLPKKIDKRVLQHEQTHFDISELHARKLRKMLTEAKFSKKIKPKVKSVYKEIERQRRQMQVRFDLETDHSNIKKAELQWEELIAKKLKEYERWK